MTKAASCPHSRRGKPKRRKKRSNCVSCEFWLLLVRLAKDQRPSLSAEICQILGRPASECHGLDFHPFSFLLLYFFPSLLPRWIKEINLPPPSTVSGCKLIRRMWEFYHDKKSHFKNTASDEVFLKYVIQEPFWVGAQSMAERESSGWAQCRGRFPHFSEN